MRLPLLANLSPEVLVEIHEDSKYNDFRKGLAEVLDNIDSEVDSQNFANRVAEIESDILLPKVEAIYQEVQSNKFKDALQEGFTTFAQTFVGNFLSGTSIETALSASGISGVAGVISSVLGKIIKKHTESSERRIWIQLLPEKPTIPIYGSSVTLRQITGDTSNWDIEQYPSQKIKVSSGILKIPWEARDPSASQGNKIGETSSRQVSETPGLTVEKKPSVPRNSPCPCGSGRKYKHCHGKKAH